jgi:hypothetical protein
LKITREFIFAGQSVNGGWSRAQVQELGVEWPLRLGWINEVVGKEVSQESADMFINLTNSHITGHYADTMVAKKHMRSIRHEQ